LKTAVKICWDIESLWNKRYDKYKMAPKIRIPAHVFGYSLALVPPIAYAMYWQRNKQSDEEIEKVLKENYTKNIQGNRDKKADMVNFFAAMKEQNNPEQEKKMQEVLYGGRGDIKRHYAVDESLYGTEKGVEGRMIAEKENEKKLKKRKKKKKKKAEDSENMKKDDVVINEQTKKGLTVESTGIAALGAVGVLAAASFLIGGNKRS